MRTLFPLLLLVALSGGRTADTDRTTDEVQIQNALEKMNQAAGVLDADRFMAWYLHSPSLVLIFDGQTIRGWQANLDQQHKWWSGIKPGMIYTDERAPEITLQSADIATTLQWMLVDNSRGAAHPTRLTVTSVWKHVPDGWRIIMAHESLTR